jgi:hypothetical protein
MSWLAQILEYASRGENALAYFVEVPKTNQPNKLECLSFPSLSSLAKYMWARPGAYP